MTDPEQTAGASDDLPMLSRAEVGAQIQARRDGQVTDAALAAWAFKMFYDEDMGLLELEQDAEEEIREVLDTLMFADDATFALDDAALDELLKRIQP